MNLASDREPPLYTSFRDIVPSLAWPRRLPAKEADGDHGRQGSSDLACFQESDDDAEDGKFAHQPLGKRPASSPIRLIQVRSSPKRRIHQAAGSTSHDMDGQHLVRQSLEKGLQTSWAAALFTGEDAPLRRSQYPRLRTRYLPLGPSRPPHHRRTAGTRSGDPSSLGTPRVEAAPKIRLHNLEALCSCARCGAWQARHRREGRAGAVAASRERRATATTLDGRRRARAARARLSSAVGWPRHRRTLWHYAWRSKGVSY